MSFPQNLKAAMNERQMNQKQLAGLTGLAVSSISQYLSGKTAIPKEQTLEKIAQALETSVDFLKGETPEMDTNSEGMPCKRLSVEMAAKMLAKSEQFIRVSLQRGTAPFGFAVMMPSGKWSYHISPKKFIEYIGKVETA